MIEEFIPAKTERFLASRLKVGDSRIALSDDEFGELRDALRESIGFGDGSDEEPLMRWLTTYFQVTVLDSGYQDTVDRLINGNARR